MDLPSFVSLDFETANQHRASPCAIGLVRVVDGAIVAEDSWLMRPPEGFDFFRPQNIRVHGIHPHRVKGLPRFGETYQRLREFVGPSLVIGHNVAFDIQVAQKAAVASGLPMPSPRWMCTVALARQLLDLPDYRLPTVSAALGVSLTSHHDAAADARAAAQVMCALVALPGFDPDRAPRGQGRSLFRSAAPARG